MAGEPVGTDAHPASSAMAWTGLVFGLVLAVAALYLSLAQAPAEPRAGTQLLIVAAFALVALALGLLQDRKALVWSATTALAGVHVWSWFAGARSSILVLVLLRSLSAGVLVAMLYVLVGGRRRTAQGEPSAGATDRLQPRTFGTVAFTLVLVAVVPFIIPLDAWPWGILIVPSLSILAALAFTAHALLAPRRVGWTMGRSMLVGVGAYAAAGAVLAGYLAVFDPTSSILTALVWPAWVLTEAIADLLLGWSV